MGRTKEQTREVLQWHRLVPGRYETTYPDGTRWVVCWKEHPMNGHFGLWVIEGRSGSFDTLQSAKDWVLRNYVQLTLGPL